MKDLGRLVKQCLSDLESIDIRCGSIRKWEINSRAKARWGQCKQISENLFDISINCQLLCDDVDDQMVKNTIVHELLHTLPGCMCHTGRWKELAAIVNRQLPYYTIRRMSPRSEKGLPELNHRYVIECTQCGQMILRNRKSRLIVHPANYRCGICGGSLIRKK